MRPALLYGATDKNCIIVGSLESKYVRQLIKSKKLDKRELQGKNEKYVITTVDNPLDGVDKALVIAGSDRRGNVRRLPDEKERMHPGGWGMYYHVDYVGAPRNSKWMNMTPIQGMWEQLHLTYRVHIME